MILLARGWSAEDVGDALLIDPNTVHNHFKRYEQGGLPGLLHVAYRGSDCELDTAQLDAHLQTQLYLSAEDMAAWVAETFGILYTVSGMTAVPHRLGFVYKKPKLVPGKADRTAQEAFLAEYENLRRG